MLLPRIWSSVPGWSKDVRGSGETGNAADGASTEPADTAAAPEKGDDAWRDTGGNPMDEAPKPPDQGVAVDLPEAGGPEDSLGASDSPGPDEALDGTDLPSCHGSVPLRCGDRLDGNTSSPGARDEWFGYSCSQRLENGPEVVFAFRTDGTCQVALRLTHLAVDLNLYVLDACDIYPCVANSTWPLDIQDIESVAFQQEAGQTRFVSVDGYDDASGTFALEADCLCGTGAAPFGDGPWRLQVDRRRNHAASGGQFPDDPLDEKDYEPVQDGPTYAVTVSQDWRSVTIGSEPLLGTSIPDPTGALRYDLSTGTFAGGRFRVWVGETGLQAERTLYGSGVPIVISERGPLLPASPSR